MTLYINAHLSLQSLETNHSEALNALCVKNKNHLGTWLPWVKHVADKNFISDFIARSIHQYASGIEIPLLIMYNGKMIGRIGINRIVAHNHIGEIGYWIDEDYTGKGLVTECCIRLLQYGFEELLLNRIEIKCAVGNTASSKIPEKLGFVCEGILRQAERLDSGYADIKLFSLLKKDFVLPKPENNQ